MGCKEGLYDDLMPLLHFDTCFIVITGQYLSYSDLSSSCPDFNPHKFPPRDEDFITSKPFPYLEFSSFFQTFFKHINNLAGGRERSQISIEMGAKLTQRYHHKPCSAKVNAKVLQCK